MAISNDIFSSNNSGYEAIEENHFLDATGLFCPEPVMMLHGKITEVCEGEVLKILATDPSTQRDIPKFCVFLGHELLMQHEVDGVYCYFLRKGKASD